MPNAKRRAGVCSVRVVAPVEERLPCRRRSHQGATAGRGPALHHCPPARMAVARPLPASSRSLGAQSVRGSDPALLRRLPELARCRGQRARRTAAARRDGRGRTPAARGHDGKTPSGSASLAHLPSSSMAGTRLPNPVPHQVCRVASTALPTGAGPALPVSRSCVPPSPTRTSRTDSDRVVRRNRRRTVRPPAACPAVRRCGRGCRPDRAGTSRGTARGRCRRPCHRPEPPPGPGAPRLPAVERATPTDSDGL